MSVEVILIPLGIAAYAAFKEHHRTDLCEGCQQTRVADQALMVRALQQLGAHDVLADGDIVTAQTQTGTVRFQMIQGVFLGRVDGGTEIQTAQLISDVNAAAGAVVQKDKVEEMRTRAAQLGLVLVGEEVSDDGTVQLVFEEAQ